MPLLHHNLTCSFSNFYQCYFQFLNHTVPPFSDLTVCHLLQFPPCLFIIFCLLFTLPPFLLCLVWLLSLSLSLSLLFSSHRLPSPPSSAHVDMSNVSFDVDPLDLDAEEPPEFQGDPRSSKGMSGSVTSPQANAHRLPFFKKVTLGAQDTSLTSSLPASLPHLSPTPPRSLMSSSLLRLSLTEPSPLLLNLTPFGPSGSSRDGYAEICLDVCFSVLVSRERR